MKCFLLLALTAVALVGCQSPRNKYISKCASPEGMEFFNLTLNEWKELCPCQYDLMMEGNTNAFDAGTECRKKLKIGEFKE